MKNYMQSSFRITSVNMRKKLNKKMKQLFTKRGKLFLVSVEEPTCFAKITKNIQINSDKLLKNDMKYCSEKKNHV